MRNWCDPNKYIIIKRFSRSFPTSIWVANIGVVLQMQLARITLYTSSFCKHITQNHPTIFRETGKEVLIYEEGLFMNESPTKNFVYI